MKKVIVLMFMMPLLGSAHPLKFTSLFIQYNPSDSSVFMEFRMFSDDMNLAIKKEKQVELPDSPNDFEEDDNAILNEYINNHVKVSFGNQEFDLKFDAMRYIDEMLLLMLKFEFEGVQLVKGDEVKVSNDMLMEHFPYSQSNVVVLDIPNVVKSTVKFWADDFSRTFPVD